MGQIAGEAGPRMTLAKGRSLALRMKTIQTRIRKLPEAEASDVGGPERSRRSKSEPQSFCLLVQQTTFLSTRGAGITCPICWGLEEYIKEIKGIQVYPRDRCL